MVFGVVTVSRKKVVGKSHEIGAERQRRGEAFPKGTVQGGIGDFFQKSRADAAERNGKGSMVCARMEADKAIAVPGTP